MDEEKTEKLLYELENETGNYSCYDIVMIITYYKNLYKKEKENIEKLKHEIHEILDANGITRAYQLLVDDKFDEILKERAEDE